MNDYEALYREYESNKDKLMDAVKVETESTNYYNETPQNDGFYGDEGHATNTSKNDYSSENDFDTPIARLKEIERDFSNLLLKWSNEFEPLFIEEGNI